MKCPVFVTLTEADITRAKNAALVRHNHSLHRATSHGYMGDSLTAHTHGCYGELAYCNGVGCEWEERVDNFKDADVGEDIQVRCAPCKAPRPPAGFGNLIVYSNDKPHHRYVCVAGNAPYFVIRGWLFGHEAMLDRWWTKITPERPSQWLVPSINLHTDLTDLIEQPKPVVVQNKDGHFEHYCHCGKEAGWGFGVSLLNDKPGTWYCREHKPAPR